MPVCSYLQNVPLDPANGQQRQTAGVATGTCPMSYEISVQNGVYEIRVRQESQGNFIKVTGDGGDDTAASCAGSWYEIGTNLTLL